MKKRLQRLLCMLLVIIFAVTGCSKGNTNSNATNTPDSTESSDTANDNSEVEEANTDDKEVPEYLYTQDLNVIDDNYRNYYEIFLYSYYDSDGDGIGDINGLISKLDYLNDGDHNTDTDLGINGIWLMPIMTSPSYHKYDVVDYYSIDTEYGTIEDFKNLIAECDKRGIKVIIDLVLNHTSNQNPWFTSAVKSLAIEPCGQEVCTHEELCREHNKYCDYYNFVSEKPADGAYYKAGDSGWYYEGVFVDSMPDLNLANEELRSDIEDIIDYWVDLGVGGFRLDAAKEFYSGNEEKNTEILQWITDYVKGKSEDLYLVAEVWDSFSIFTKYYKSGIDSIFNFAFAQETGKITKTLLYSDSLNTAKAFGEAMILVQDTIKKYNENAIDAPFMSNHDTGRIAGLLNYNEEKMKMAGAMNLFMSGSSFVYYGEEIGMSGSGRDENKRAPMVWSNTDSTGMTNGPKAMETVTHKFESVEDQLKDPTSILNFYKRAIRIKNENPEIARGTIEYLSDVTDVDLCAISKEYEGSKIFMIYNISEEEKTVTLSKSKYGYTDIRGYLSATSGAVTIDNETITLPPYSIVILK